MGLPVLWIALNIHASSSARKPTEHQGNRKKRADTIDNCTPTNITEEGRERERELRNSRK
jgi:hypothetical protein